MANWMMDAQARTVSMGDRVVTLTGRESEALAYLFARAGSVVSRTELETEVWGMGVGAISETVPVTIRNIRSKLGPQGREILQMVRGEGYRVVGGGRSPTLPQPATPFFPRPAEIDAVHRLLKDKWRIVTLVGPGGAGKTRLALEVAEELTDTVLFVEAGTFANREDVVRGLATAAGLASNDVQALRRALIGDPVVVLLDEVEGAIKAVSDVVGELSFLRFLITSRVDLGRTDEAVHPVSPMQGDEGRRFARSMLRASRWSEPTDDATLDRLVHLVDGLPLGVELVTRTSHSPLVMLAQLEAGEPTEAVDVMDRVVSRSCAALSIPHLETLQALSVPEGGLTDAHIRSWLGEAHFERVQDLGHRSLLVRQGEEWRVLRTVRRFVQRSLPGRTLHTASFDQWLIAHIAQINAELLITADGGLDVIAAFTQDLLGTLRRLPLAQATEGVWALCMLAHIRGPLTLLTTAIAHFPPGGTDAPLVDLLRRASPSLRGSENVFEVLRHGPLQDRYRIATLHIFSWLPAAEDPAALLPGKPSTAMEQWLEDLMASAGDPARLRALQSRLSSDALAQLLTRVILAQSLSTTDKEASRHEWALLLQDLEHTKLSHLQLMAMGGLADASAHSDPERARAQYHEVARLAERRGLADTWVVGRAGLWLFLLGDEGAQPWLEQGARERRRGPRRVCECALAIARWRGGAPNTVLDVSGVEGRLVDGTSLAQLLETIALIEALPSEVDRHTQLAWQVAPDTQAFRVWKRTELVRVKDTDRR